MTLEVMAAIRCGRRRDAMDGAVDAQCL